MTKPILCKYWEIAYSSISCNPYRTNFRGAYDPAVVVVNLEKQIYVKESYAVGQWSCSLSSTLKELQEYHQTIGLGFQSSLNIGNTTTFVKEGHLWTLAKEATEG